MKRFWIGGALLLAILAAGLWTGKRMEKIHTDVVDRLRDCGQAAQEQRWEQAEAAVREAKERWEAGWTFSAALSDHTALEEIDGDFGELQVYLKNRDALRSAALCAKLAQMVDAVQESHRLTWRNLL